MSPIRMFSVKLLEPTMMVPLEEEPEDEELPVDGDRPQEVNKTTNALIIVMNINVIFFVIVLLLSHWSTIMRHFSIICVPAV